MWHQHLRFKHSAPAEQAEGGPARALDDQTLRVIKRSRITAPVCSHRVQSRLLVWAPRGCRQAASGMALVWVNAGQGVLRKALHPTCKHVRLGNKAPRHGRSKGLLPLRKERGHSYACADHMDGTNQPCPWHAHSVHAAQRDGWFGSRYNGRPAPTRLRKRSALKCACHKRLTARHTQAMRQKLRTPTRLRTSHCVVCTGGGQVGG